MDPGNSPGVHMALVNWSSLRFKAKNEEQLLW